MSLAVEREKIVEEIQLIPEDKLAEIYAILHYFRLGVEAAHDQMPSVMQYAGCWRDMAAETFAEFAQEVAARRHGAFGRRRTRETSTD